MALNPLISGELPSKAKMFFVAHPRAVPPPIGKTGGSWARLPPQDFILSRHFLEVCSRDWRYFLRFWRSDGCPPDLHASPRAVRGTWKRWTSEIVVLAIADYDVLFTALTEHRRGVTRTGLHPVLIRAAL